MTCVLLVSYVYLPSLGFGQEFHAWPTPNSDAQNFALDLQNSESELLGSLAPDSGLSTPSNPVPPPTPSAVMPASYLGEPVYTEQPNVVNQVPMPVHVNESNEYPASIASRIFEPDQWDASITALYMTRLDTRTLSPNPSPELGGDPGLGFQLRLSREGWTLAPRGERLDFVFSNLSTSEGLIGSTGNLEYESTLRNFELNSIFSTSSDDIEFVFGARHIHLGDNLMIHDLSDPGDRFAIESNNDLLGLQLGFRTAPSDRPFELAIAANAGAAINLISGMARVFDNGLLIDSTRDSETRFSPFVDASLEARYRVGQAARFAVGVHGLLVHDTVDMLHPSADKLDDTEQWKFLGFHATFSREF